MSTETTTTRSFVSQDVLVKSYKAAIAAGKSIEDLAHDLGIQPASIKSRVKVIRTQLVEACSLTPEQAKRALPNFSRKGGSGRKAGVSDLVRGLAESILTEPDAVPVSGNADGETV
jgi:hypothetical protein